MSASHPLPAPGSRLPPHARPDRKRFPLHPAERAVLVAVTVHLCFLPWAIGTMHVWSQLTSLGLALVSFRLALLSRNYTAVHTGGPAFRLNPWPRLLKFPLFWVGLALLGYIAIQGLNPSWVWERNATQWWLRRVDDIPWLPTSVDTPFERFNLWRQFIIYASAWLTVCAIWVGFTRRHTLELLLTCLASNGLLLAVVGGYFRLNHDWDTLPWSKEIIPGATAFASFIYKNHAGAYLALMVATFVTLACVHHERSERILARSSPAVLFLLGALAVTFAVVATYSRGATLLVLVFLVVAAAIFLLNRILHRVGPAMPPLATLMVVLLSGVFVAFGATQFDYQRAAGRFNLLRSAQDVSRDFRLEANLASLEMLEQRGLRGVGAGGFRYLYPEHIRHHPKIYEGGRLFWEHAHNDWLQIPIELGAAGVFLLLVGGSWWLLQLVRLRAWLSLPALLLLLGLVQTPLHALFDFPLQNPAVLITWCVLSVLLLRRLELDPAET